MRFELTKLFHISESLHEEKEESLIISNSRFYGVFDCCWEVLKNQKSVIGISNQDKTTITKEDLISGRLQILLSKQSSRITSLTVVERLQMLVFGTQSQTLKMLNLKTLKVIKIF